MTLHHLFDSMDETSRCLFLLPENKKGGIKMAITTFKGTARSVEGLRVEGKARGLRTMFDEPEDLGGTNEGMNPIEMMLNSLGACQVITAKLIAQDFDVKIDEMWVEIEGDVDLDGFRGVPGVKSGLTEIRFQMNFVTDSPEANVRKLAAEVERRCPVGATLTASVGLREAEIKCYSKSERTFRS